MTTKLVSAILIAGASIIAGRAAAQSKTCHLQALGELQLTQGGGYLTIEGAINGNSVRLVVDTGSPATMLFDDATSKIGLVSRKMPNVTFYGVGGPEDAYTTWVRELRVANLTLGNATLFVSKGSVHAAAGLLGAKFLFQSDVEFDLAHNAVRFFKATNCVGDQVVYWGAAYSVTPLVNSVDDSPLVVVKLNGRPIEAEMDTGSPRSVVTVGAAQQFGRVHASTAAGKISGLGPHTEIPLSVASFDSFAFEDETIGNTRLRIADLFAKDTETPLGSRLGAPVGFAPQMLLGADFFRSHRIFFSREQRKVYISYQGGPVFASPPDPMPPA